MPRRKKTSWSVKTHVDRYIKQISQYKEIFHRALFKSPKRIVISGEHPMGFIEKMKWFIQKTPLTSRIFFGSLGFLLFALGYASNPNKDNDDNTLMHQVSKIIQENKKEDPIVVDPTVIQEKQIEEIVDNLIANTDLTQEDTTPTPSQPETIQLVYSLITSINNGSYTVGDYFDTYMKTSSLVQSYFTAEKLKKFRQSLVGDIVVKSAEEFSTDREDRVWVNYTIAYTLATTQQSFEETRSVVLRPQSGWWRIGIFRCETRWCSVNPFFNPEKYNIK